MRLFLLNWPSDLGLDETVRRLRDCGHRITYWVVADKGVFPRLRRDFPDTVFHGHYDALAGVPAEGVDASAFPPPGRGRLRELFADESVMLSMLGKRFEGSTVEERKRRYLCMVRYWDGVLARFRPEAMIFPAAPHSVYDYLLYEEARRRGIRTFVFEGTVIGDRMLLNEDFRQGHPLLLPGAWQGHSVHMPFSSAGKDVREYLEREEARASAAGTVPEFKVATYPAVRVLLSGRYGQSAVFRRRLRALARSIADFSFLSIALRFLSNRLGQNLRKEYASVSFPPRLDRPFVYVPLHYQPEQSTITQGDVFVDQRLMVEILSMALPEGWMLYVKEHPYQWLARGVGFFSLRPRDYYRSLALLKNVRIIPVATNTFALIRSAQAVATVSGAAGFESLLYGKPSLLFGHVWFKNAPGVFRVEDVEGCRRALSRVARGHVFSPGELCAFLGDFDRASFRGYLDREWAEASDLPREENVENVSRVLLAALKRGSDLL